MLFKLSVNNIRKSLRDYAIYFFTLIIGISVFYVFNAIHGQTAMMRIDSDTRELVELLRTMLSGVSVFVAGVLGLLIVYASRFLMKRRNKEFALYMMLGMSKGKISALLLTETVIIGLGSLGVGLLIGIGLSQLMSALVANLFEADMTEYKFMVSGDSIVLTIINFAVMYLVVVIFNSVSVSRLKLIDLIQSGKKSEQIKLKNPILCVIVFILSVVMLGYAYYQVGWKPNSLEESSFIIYIAMGAVSTFLIFWSVSGMLLRVVMSVKKFYYNHLNSFIFRQISSKVNTMVFSMTVICLMLFVTICALSGSFSIRNSLKANLEKYCPADIEINAHGENPVGDLDVLDYVQWTSSDFMSYIGDYVHFSTYGDENFRFFDFVEEEDLPAATFFNNYVQTLITISDYNALMNLYHKEPLTLQDGQYILICNFANAKDCQNKALKKGTTITVFGHTLSPQYDTCQDGFIELSAQQENFGIFIVPDNVIDSHKIAEDFLIGNYVASDKDGKAETETKLQTLYREELVTNMPDFSSQHRGAHIGLFFNTKIDIANGSIGIGAIATFLGLYIGLVFLIACGALLSLKELSESVDSIPRYEILRKIGVDENDIAKSLFQQTGIFFLLPLLLACIHSVFGMKFATYFLQYFGTEEMAESIIATSIMILLIYGGYFLITYYCSKNIIKDRK